MKLTEQEKKQIISEFKGTEIDKEDDAEKKLIKIGIKIRDEVDFWARKHVEGKQ